MVICYLTAKVLTLYAHRRNLFINGRDLCESRNCLLRLSFGCPLYCFLINGDHFCLFQNTIFRIDSRVPVRIFGNQRVTKTENKLLFA